MKRMLRAALIAAAAVCISAMVANAAPYQDFKDVPFRKYHSSGTQAVYLTSPTTKEFYSDSIFVSVNSTGGPALAADTTAPFRLENLAFTPTGVGADSISLCTVSLSPVYTNGTSVTADSFSVKLQASWNGIDWVTGVGVDLVENNSSNTFMRHFAFARNSAATATNIQLGTFPLYRVIWTDFTGTTGDFKCGVSWWREP